ncbi:MAG: diguanylate cyclase [Deltaproteobacteria bacterium]|nr:diguanylate cyclase [Deltaproteobacteria bacterium]
MKTIVIVSRDPLLTTIADRLLAAHFKTIVLGGMVSAVDVVYNDIPDLLIADLITGEAATVEIINNLKDDPMFNQLPVLVITGDQPPVARWEELFAEDWLRRADLERDLLSRASLAVIRSERTVEINPLTRLPGNISINRQIQERMERGEIFSFAYADLSDFKPFNDKYGFSRGDEVIKITGRLLLNIVKNRQPRGSFIGHIGGDDFVFIMEPALIEETCGDIIRAFDQIIPTVYDPEDREKGGIDSVDRRGVARFFPFVGLSIGVTGTGNRRFSHFGELTGAASEMKHFAKKTKGSSFSIDNRSNLPV